MNVRVLSSCVIAATLCATASVPAQQGTITLARARTIALARVANNQGVTSSKLKHKNGVDVYEFDIETPGPGHQEVRVDARTGAVLSSTHEDDIVGKAKTKFDATKDKVFGKDEIATVKPAISEQRARAIAQQQVPNAPVKDIDLETKHGVLVWEVDLDTAGPGHEEVLIDATTGDVLRRKHQDDIVSKTIDKIKK